MRSNVILGLFLSVFLAGCTGAGQKREKFVRPSAAALTEQAQKKAQAQAEAALEKAKREQASVEADPNATEERKQKVREATAAAQRVVDQVNAERSGNADTTTPPAVDGANQTPPGSATTTLNGDDDGNVAAPEGGGAGGGDTNTAEEVGGDPEVSQESLEADGIAEAKVPTEVQRKAIMDAISKNGLWDFMTFETVADTAIPEISKKAMFTEECPLGSKYFLGKVANVAKFKELIELLKRNEINGQNDIYISGNSVGPQTEAVVNVAREYKNSEDIGKNIESRLESRALSFAKSAILSLYLRTQTIGVKSEMNEIGKALGVTVSNDNEMLPEAATGTESRLYVRIKKQEKKQATCADMGSKTIVDTTDAQSGFAELIGTSLATVNTSRATENKFEVKNFLVHSESRNIFVSLSKDASTQLLNQSAGVTVKAASVIATAKAVTESQKMSDEIFSAQYSRTAMNVSRFAQKNSTGEDIFKTPRKMIGMGANFLGVMEVIQSASGAQQVNALHLKAFETIAHTLTQVEFAKISTGENFTKFSELKNSKQLSSVEVGGQLVDLFDSGLIQEQAATAAPRQN